MRADAPLAAHVAESAVVKAIVTELELRGALVYNQHGSAYTGRGRPDLLGVLPGGRAFAFEVKRPGESDSGLGLRQRRELWAWASRGALTLAGVDDVKTVRAALDSAGVLHSE